MPYAVVTANRKHVDQILCHESTMANARPQEEERQGQGWLRTILNAVTIYFAINAVSSFIGGRLGAQKNGTSPDGDVKPASSRGAEQIPALWSLGTVMVSRLKTYVNNIRI